MNALRNSVQLIGRLGTDVEFKTLSSGSNVATFPIATNEYYKNSDGEKVNKTEWHNIVAWGKTAELMNSILTKGSEVIIQGKITSRSYEDKDGNKKYVTEIKASEFVCFDKRDTPF